jgi:hypothetical protein
MDHSIVNNVVVLSLICIGTCSCHNATLQAACNYITSHIILDATGDQGRKLGCQSWPNLVILAGDAILWTPNFTPEPEQVTCDPVTYPDLSHGQAKQHAQKMAVVV